mgnify:CR=1 FL=1
MIPLFTPTNFEDAKPQQRLPVRCRYCQKVFYRPKHEIQSYINPRQSKTGDFCSSFCDAKYRNLGRRVPVSCDRCGASFSKTLSAIQKTRHNFCSQSCAARYHNSHKVTGTRRSKLEKWLEVQLVQAYPDLEFQFNRTDAIDAELDIYIPSLKLAFELNGIFHYEPIYGADKLKRVHANDHRKILACAERGIELCVIDNSKMTYFKEARALPIIQGIQSILDQAISRESVDPTLMSDAT